MKKLSLTLAILLATGMVCFAQFGGGLFQRGEVSEDTYFSYYYGSDYLRPVEGSGLVLPGSHGETDDANAPLGSGLAVLVSLGAAYLATKKRGNDR